MEDDKQIADDKVKTEIPPVEDDKKEEPKSTVPYDRFKQVNDDKKALQDRLDKLEQAEKDRKEKGLKEQNKFEELYQNSNKEKQALEQKILDLEMTAERNRLVVKAEIPADLAELVPLGTAEEMQVVIDKIKASIPEQPNTPTVPNVNSPSAAKPATIDDDKKAKILAKYGLKG